MAWSTLPEGSGSGSGTGTGPPLQTDVDRKKIIIRGDEMRPPALHSQSTPPAISLLSQGLQPSQGSQATAAATIFERRSLSAGPTPLSQSIGTAPTPLRLSPHKDQQRFSLAFPESSTAPIAIPSRPVDESHKVTTPLTGRCEEKPGHQFPFEDITPKKPQISQSLRPSYLLYDKNTRALNSPLRRSPAQQLASTMSRDQTSPGYTPTSPLSPTPTKSVPRPIQQRIRREAGQGLKIPSLPRFHPANFQSSSSNSTTSTDSPTKGKPSRLGQPHHRQLSDAQMKLHHYQRELVASATRASLVDPATGKIETPPPPSIKPCGSPGTGPATPLMLEDSVDYLTARVRDSQSNFAGGSPRELVDMYIREETERGLHPGLGSQGSSPAVSPAGGRG